MGLDMYARARNTPIAQLVDFKTQEDDAELHYWRKHPDLHGWMQALYVEKGGQDPSFNGNAVNLTLGDLDRLERDLKARSLPETSGFFFGKSSRDDREGDLVFVKKARDVLNAGGAVYYDSWW